MEPRSSLPSFPVLTGVLIGMAVEVPAAVLAIMSGGAGHGDYVAARALFPMPMLVTLLGPVIGMLWGVLALLQFPLYGALLGWCARRKIRNAAWLLAGLHLIAALACFSGALPDFS